MAAKPVTKEGVKWVVGDGRSIKIWDENWLPSTESSKIITPRTSMGRETRVASLIVQEQVEWKVVWKLQCPNKVKHFMWKAYKNVLPTKQCLLNRKVLKEDSCDFCGESESVGRILWGCVIAKET